MSKTVQFAGITVVATVAAAVKLIDSIAATGKQLESDIHVAAVSALYHADKHGDVTIMQRLIAALPGFGRRNALIAWAVAHGKFAPSEDGLSVKYAKHAESDIEAGAAKPFWDFKPERPFVPFDLGAELAKLVKRAEKAAKDERNSLPEDGFRKLRELQAAIKPVEA